MLDFLKKYHKWLSIIFAFFIILFSISGIILNHRSAFSGIDINRNYLPSNYSIVDWNNAAVKSTLKINKDTIFIYGNMGIWKTDSSFSDFSDFNQGFPKGIDNRKVCVLFYSSSKNLFAGTFFGLYKYDYSSKSFNKIEIPTHEQRIVDIIEKDNQLYFLTRSHLLISNQDTKEFEIHELPQPENYDNKIGLFKTLWVIHSGEIYGEIGKLFVDIIGLIFIFLTVTGLILFINRKRILKKAIQRKPVLKIKSINKWNLKWHNKIGWITAIFLIFTTITGMFLRPPLLIPIAYAKVGKIPGTELAQTNPWFDKLRRIMYDEEEKRFIVATLDGFYYSDDNFKSDLIAFNNQPPASVMGVTVFKKTAKNTYLIGSFEGLFEWNTNTGKVWDYIEKKTWVKPKKKSRPIGKYLVTAYTDDYKGEEIIFEYNRGAININNGIEFSKQPEIIAQEYRLSLWNLGLEIHTGRIYEFLFGIFYILVVPLSGFGILFILISGFIVWWQMHRQ